MPTIDADAHVVESMVGMTPILLQKSWVAKTLVTAEIRLHVRGVSVLSRLCTESV